MGNAQCLEVLFADEEQCGVIDGSYRRGVISTVKARQLRHRASRPINAEHLLAPTRRTLTDTDVPGFDNIQAQTRFTLAKNNLARCVVAWNCALQEESEFALGQPGKDRDLRQRLTMIDLRLRHSGYCSRAHSSCDISHMHPVTTLAGLTTRWEGK
jgi:hypothetical protein